MNDYIPCTRRESPCLHSMPKLPGWVLHCPGNVHYDGGRGKRRGMMGELQNLLMRLQGKLMPAVAVIAVSFSLDAGTGSLNGMHGQTLM